MKFLTDIIHEQNNLLSLAAETIEELSKENRELRDMLPGKKESDNEATKIKIEMLKKGITGAAIARRIGVTRVAIHLTITGEIKSRKLRSAIAEAVGIPYRELWNSDNHKKAA